MQQVNDPIQRESKNSNREETKTSTAAVCEVRGLPPYKTYISGR